MKFTQNYKFLLSLVVGIHAQPSYKIQHYGQHYKTDEGIRKEIINQKI